MLRGKRNVLRKEKCLEKREHSETRDVLRLMGDVLSYKTETEREVLRCSDAAATKMLLKDVAEGCPH